MMTMSDMQKMLAKKAGSGKFAPVSDISDARKTAKEMQFLSQRGLSQVKADVNSSTTATPRSLVTGHDDPVGAIDALSAAEDRGARGDAIGSALDEALAQERVMKELAAQYPEAAAGLRGASGTDKAKGALYDFMRGEGVTHRQKALFGAEMGMTPAGAILGLLLAGRGKKLKGAMIGGGAGLAAAGATEAYRRGAFDPIIAKVEKWLADRKYASQTKDASYTAA